MWARVDDGWWCHPKVMGLGLAARGLWVSSLSWCEMTGFEVVPHVFLTVIGATEANASDLVAAGLWVPHPDGWVHVDWSLIQRPRRRPHIPDSLRRAIYERDGHACLLCGCPDDLTLDHVLPWSLGGQDTYENLRTLCRPCNSRRGAPSPGEDA